MKFKRPMAALVYALLRGRSVTIKNGFLDFGITNIPREISRAVEKKFDVRVNRRRREYITVYGLHTQYFEYTLDKSKQKKESIEKMEKFVEENIVNHEYVLYTHQNLF